MRIENYWILQSPGDHLATSYLGVTAETRFWTGIGEVMPAACVPTSLRPS